MYPGLLGPFRWGVGKVVCDAKKAADGRWVGKVVCVAPRRWQAGCRLGPGEVLCDVSRTAGWR